jgi:hypothetical protein
MGGRAGWQVFVEEGKGRARDEVINGGHSCSCFLIFNVGEPQGIMRIKVAQYETVTRDDDNVQKIQGISWRAEGG